MTSDYWNRKHFADYVSRALIDRELPPWYVAYYCELSDATFRKYMKCTGLPSPIKLIMVAELFECSVNDLLGYKSYCVEYRDRRFDSGRDTKTVSAYFVDHLLRYMEDCNYSRSDLAAKVCISTFTMDRYIDEQKLPDTSTLIRIAETLDCTPSDLLGY